MTDPSGRPYLHPVHDPSGRTILTEDRPADHPWQHGIFTGFHRVNGLNYWKEDQGRQREPRGRSEPDGQGARAECHRWRTTATSHASAGATTAPYHQSAERPATRMLPASEGSAPMSG